MRSVASPPIHQRAARGSYCNTWCSALICDVLSNGASHKTSRSATINLRHAQSPPLGLQGFERFSWRLKPRLRILEESRRIVIPLSSPAERKPVASLASFVSTSGRFSNPGSPGCILNAESCEHQWFRLPQASPRRRVDVASDLKNIAMSETYSNVSITVSNLSYRAQYH